MGRYSNRFVLALLVDGQVQKDLANGEVHIPFGSEYVVRCRNKNDRRAVVELRLDGEIVGSFVVNANSHIDIKRWADKDVAFKFVDLESPDAYDHGKQGPNPDKIKGLVEARFKLEKAKPAPAKVEHIHHYHPYPVYPPVVQLPVQPTYPKKPWNDIYWSCNTGGGGRTSNMVSPAVMNSVPRSGGACDMTAAVNTADSCLASYNAAPVSASVGGLESLGAVASCFPGSGSLRSQPTAAPLQEGCTVEGNRTGQNFYDVYIDTEDDETVLTLFIKGYHKAPKAPAAAVIPKYEEPAPLVSHANFCIQCGMARMDASAKFCGNCGNRF